jgi:5'-3' exonuclease
MIALIDGDIVTYRVGYTTEDADFGIARWRANEMLEGILRETSADEFKIYLSDSTENGFRSQILSSYKATRTQPKPKHYDALKEYLISSEWNAAITLGQEADDQLGIDQVSLNEVEDWPDGAGWASSVICSIDKDLFQVPGNHYNFVKKQHAFVTPEGGLWYFYKQLLTGDVVDNIKGIYGIGPKKAEKILQGVETESDLFSKALGAYQAWCEKEWKKPIKEWKDFEYKQVCDIILVTGRVLKIRTKKDELWNFPMEFTHLQPTLADQLQSTQ